LRRKGRSAGRVFGSCLGRFEREMGQSLPMPVQDRSLARTDPSPPFPYALANIQVAPLQLTMLRISPTGDERRQGLQHQCSLLIPLGDLAPCVRRLPRRWVIFCSAAFGD